MPPAPLLLWRVVVQDSYLSSPLRETDLGTESTVVPGKQQRGGSPSAGGGRRSFCRSECVARGPGLSASKRLGCQGATLVPEPEKRVAEETGEPWSLSSGADVLGARAGGSER